MGIQASVGINFCLQPCPWMQLFVMWQLLLGFCSWRFDLHFLKTYLLHKGSFSSIYNGRRNPNSSWVSLLKNYLIQGIIQNAWLWLWMWLKQSKCAEFCFVLVSFHSLLLHFSSPGYNCIYRFPSENYLRIASGTRHSLLSTHILLLLSFHVSPPFSKAEKLQFLLLQSVFRFLWPLLQLPGRKTKKYPKTVNQLKIWMEVNEGPKKYRFLYDIRKEMAKEKKSIAFFFIGNGNKDPYLLHTQLFRELQTLENLTSNIHALYVCWCFS